MDVLFSTLKGGAANKRLGTCRDSGARTHSNFGSAVSAGFCGQVACGQGRITGAPVHLSYVLMIPNRFEYCQ